MKTEYVIFLKEMRTGCWDGYYKADRWDNATAEHWDDVVDRFNQRYPGTKWTLVVIDKTKSGPGEKPWLDLNNQALWHREPFAIRVLGQLDDAA
jgi:hypothetical protein